MGQLKSFLEELKAAVHKNRQKLYARITRIHAQRSTRRNKVEERIKPLPQYLFLRGKPGSQQSPGVIIRKPETEQGLIPEYQEPLINLKGRVK